MALVSHLCRPGRLLLVPLLSVALAPFARAETIEITDQRGRVAAFDGPAERVVFLPMPHASTYVAIDGTESHIVGMNPSSAVAMRDGILSRIFPGVLSIETDIVQGAGFAPNIESILALSPDAVFQWASMGDAVIEPLDRVGLRVLGVRCCSQEDLETYALMMGRLAGKEERARAIMDLQAARARELSDTFSGLAEADRPRVLYLGRASDSLRAGGAEGYFGRSVTLGGGRSVVAGAGGDITFEEILVLDPEVILLGNFDSAMPADLYADPRWRSVAAVRERQVYRMPLGGYRWDPPSQESALTWTWLARLLQPDRTAIDLRADMRAWYRLLYAHDLDDDETDRILFLAENGRSAGYVARFGR